MKDYGRDLRVADFVRDELSQIMQRDMRDPRVGMVSINEVKASRDLSYADVYVSSIDASDDEAKQTLVAVLNKAAGYFRSSLAQRHKMRTTPKLRFHYDDVADRAPRLDALISKAVAADEAQAQSQSGGPQGGGPQSWGDNCG